MFTVLMASHASHVSSRRNAALLFMPSIDVMGCIMVQEFNYVELSRSALQCIMPCDAVKSVNGPFTVQPHTKATSMSSHSAISFHNMAICLCFTSGQHRRPCHDGYRFVDWFLTFYVLASSKVVLGRVPTCDSGHSW